jgi:hypothetical protein
MNLAVKGSDLIFAFNLIEGRILLRVLRAILKNYALAPDEFDERGRAAWYATRGCEGAGLSAEEIREWQQALHECKSARLGQVEGWYRQLARTEQGTSRLSLPLNDAPSLLAALNDHRLLVAARQDIGQTEMDTHDLDEAEKLGHQKQAALLEIHFLAWIIEEILRHLPGEPGDWNGGAKDLPGRET